MGPTTPEKQSDQESNVSKMERLVEQAVQEIISRLEAIDASESTPQEKAQQKSEIASSVLSDYRQAQKTLESLKETTKSSEATEQQQKNIQKEQQNLRQALIKVLTLADNDVKVVENAKTQRILRELAKTPPTDSEAVAIQEALGDYLLGEKAKDIILSKQGEVKSNFIKGVDNLKSENPEAAKKLIDALVKRASDFGSTAAEMEKKFGTDGKEQIEDQGNIQYENMREQIFQRDQSEYYGRFTQDQQEFLHNLYSPTNFKNYVESEINKPDEGKKEEYKANIAKIYQEQGKNIPNEQELNRLVDNRWRQQVSQNIEMELGKVMNQLLLRLQQEGANKAYDELAQEDFMRGIRATENQIRNALITLQANLAELEKDPKHSNEYTNIKLFKFFDQGHYIDEREKEIDPITKEKRNLAYPRLYPLLQPKEIGLKDFALQLTVDMGHLLDQRNYLHDSRVVFNHPPGEHGFYSGLGGYAEKYRGTDVDEMMLLPDGNLALEAFHLYEKYLEEDFASLDWKHRPTEFTNELEYVNSKLEREIIEQMKLEYGDEISEERIKAAINIGVGLARGVFLTEPEKSSYADPVDNEGRGMVASYGTNDAGALNAFNPLHVELRWQGEHHMFMYYFMPIHGSKGAWDHKKMWENMGNYMDSYIKGNKKLPKNLFIDEMIDVCNVGGPFKRRDWRMEKSLEGHLRYNPDKEGGGVNALESFKAMDYIGYEAVADFFNNMRMGKDILKKTELAGERKIFFQYVYEQYFEKFDGADFDSYMAELRKSGEKEALKVVRGEAKDRSKDKGTTPAGSWEEQVELETSKIFFDRALVREIALRFPSKFLRIDRGRFEADGISRWYQIQKELSMGRDDFNAAMKDFIFTETLLRKEMSQKIKDQLRLDPTLDLNKVKIKYESLNEETIERLLKQTKGVGKDGKLLMTPERIEIVKKIYRTIGKNFLNGEFLNEKGIEAVGEYPFSFGVEDTDLGLMAFRGTGPRMVARAIADTGIMEQGVIPAVKNLGRMLNIMAIDGKHDFSPIIEAMIKARNAFNEVHGTGDDYNFNYKLATAVIQYFKKDSMAKPLFGLFRIGKRNSIAAEYAGRSTAVWEWDSRDIDRFCVALESHRILPKTAFDIFKVRKGKEYESVYRINPFTKKAFKTPFKKLKTDFEYNAARLRKEFGGDWKAIVSDMINQFGPLALGFLLWQYFKKAMEEAEGKKK